MLVNVHILYLFSHCVSFALLIIDFIVILHVRLIRVLLKINQSINHFRLNINSVVFTHSAARPYWSISTEWHCVFLCCTFSACWQFQRVVTFTQDIFTKKSDVLVCAKLLYRVAEHSNTRYVTRISILESKITRLAVLAARPFYDGWDGDVTIERNPALVFPLIMSGSDRWTINPSVIFLVLIAFRVLLDWLYNRGHNYMDCAISGCTVVQAPC